MIKKTIFIQTALITTFLLISGCNVNEELVEKEIQQFEAENPFNPILEVKYSNIPPKVGETMAINLTLIPKNKFDDFFVSFYLGYPMPGGHGIYITPDRESILEKGENKTVLRDALEFRPGGPGIYIISPCTQRYNPKSSVIKEYWATKCANEIYMVIGENKSIFINRSAIPQELLDDEDLLLNKIFFSGNVYPKEIRQNDDLKISYALKNLDEKEIEIQPNFLLYQIFSLDVVDTQNKPGLYEKEYLDIRGDAPTIGTIRLEPNKTFKSTITYNLSNAHYNGIKIVSDKNGTHWERIEGYGLSPGKYGIILKLQSTFCFNIKFPEVYEGIQCRQIHRGYDFPQAYMPGRPPRSISKEFQITVLEPN